MPDDFIGLDKCSDELGFKFLDDYINNCMNLDKP